MTTDTEKELLDIECCSGTGHRVRDGGSHINIVSLNKKAFSPFFAAHDFWVDGKERHPRALAVLCDACMRDDLEPIWAVGRDDSNGQIYRVPVYELGDWDYEEVIEK